MPTKIFSVCKNLWARLTIDSEKRMGNGRCAWLQPFFSFKHSKTLPACERAFETRAKCTHIHACVEPRIIVDSAIQ